MLEASGRSPLVNLLGVAVVILIAGAGAIVALRGRHTPAVNSSNFAPASASITVPQRLDSDADGLSDSEEAALGTDPHKKDTDGDGLTDYEEVKVYHTNPLKADTDGDGFSDGYEVSHGFNPNGPGPLLPTADAIRKLNASMNTNASASNTN